MKIHQLLPCLRPGDGIGNHTIEIQQILKKWGHQSSIFAVDIHDDVRSLAKPYQKLKGQALQDALHTRYLLKLSALLSLAQVDQVKDGMTYGVVPLTYQGYLDMLPTLTEEEKATIMAYLVEAREIAMDAGSSKQKHWWFGKYKGRINNYLSAQGYDLKKASEQRNARNQATSGN